MRNITNAKVVNGTWEETTASAVVCRFYINPERSAAVIGCRSRYELLFTSLSCAADLQVLPSEIVMAGGVVGIAFPL